MTGKITGAHLQRQAYVYVRQSTPGQVHDHVESTQRQYALADRAEALGWPPELVEVIDEDQGLSGSSSDGRQGFLRLAHDVAHGKVGAVLAVEVSRLARSSQDWQRLLSLCAVAQVLVVDENGIHDPSYHDDKLLLDIKGAMSEQELRWLSLRLAGGRLNKARRGKAYVTAPTGYVWGGQGLELDPDEAVRKAVHAVFERFRIEPSARAVLRWTRKTGFLMPTRDRSSGELHWRTLNGPRLYDMLHNPVYAGVYVFGRKPTKQVLVDGEIRTTRVRLEERSEWPVAIDDAHPGYITWETYLANQDKLRTNRTAGSVAARGAAREGRALLAGLLLCGRCGRRMSPHYYSSDHATSRWLYQCEGDDDERQCWSLSGVSIDAAVEELFLQTMVPDEIELGLAVQLEAEQQGDSLEQAWRARLEQARYEARLAERRYKAVDPDNRVVARTLEGDWEQRLRDLLSVEQQYEEARLKHKVVLDEQDRRRIRELAHDLPAVWRSPTTSMADRKAMLRIAIEAISLHPVEVPERATRVHVQWRGGATSELVVARPGRGAHKTSSEAVEAIRELAAAGLRDDEIADELNRRGIRTGFRLEWNEERARIARHRAGIKRLAPDRPRLPPLPPRNAAGRYSVPGAAAYFGVSHGTIYRWIHNGLVEATRADLGPHRNVFWIAIDAQTEERLARKTRSVRGRGRSTARGRKARRRGPTNR